MLKQQRFPNDLFIAICLSNNLRLAILPYVKARAVCKGVFT